jgi:hypothetical protein
MRRTGFTLLLLLLCGGFASDALAQKTGQILIVSPSGIGPSATRLLNAVKPHYAGSVGLDVKIPADLSDYDALMIVRAGWASQDGLLNAEDQLRIVNYLHSGGRLYAEAGNFRSTSKDDRDTLWTFIGDARETLTASGVWIDSILGVDGEFTEGLAFFHPFNLDPDAPYGLFIDGMTPVLMTDPTLAYRSTDPQIKAVLHWPIASEHYNDFLARVVCWYFNLCTLDAPVQADDSPMITFDPTTSEVRVPRAGNIVISDILGREVLTAYTESERYRLPERLATGNYILRWSTSNAHASVKIAVH